MYRLNFLFYKMYFIKFYPDITIIRVNDKSVHPFLDGT